MGTEIKSVRIESRRGGKRPGAGRPKGAITRRNEAMNIAIAKRIEGDGLDPVEAIMEIAEWALQRWREARDSGDAALLAEQAVDWLARAAPYIRPRLQAVEAKVNVNLSIFDRIERGRQRLAIAA